MRTKIYKIFFPVILITIFSFFVVSCDEEDNTGYSTLTPTSPTITITPGFTSPVTLVEDNSKYEFTVALSNAQLVDVHLAVAQVDGTASAADYELTSTIVIVAGTTSAKGSIKILSDDVIEATETLKIQIGDVTTANAALTPIAVEFSIKNLTVNDLSIGLSWKPSTQTTDDKGTAISGPEIADMRLLITNSPYTKELDNADGASFESYTMLGTMADGEYLIVADFFETLPTPIRDLDLSVSFEQLGVIDLYSFDFPAAINTGVVCPINYFILAKVVKAGTSYTIEKIGETQPLTKWYGTDTEFIYPSEVTTKLACDSSILITGLAVGWMVDFWGETIISQNDLKIIINEVAGTVTIPSQEYITTSYKGAVQKPYSIEGSGTYNKSGAFPTMTITYILVQDKVNIPQFCFDNKYMTTNNFVAKLTQDPTGLKSTIIRNNISIVKPVH